MIYKILPEDLKERWHVIRPELLKALPPRIAVNGVAVGNVLKALLLEHGHLWVLYKGERDQTRNPAGLIVTTFYVDPMSGAKSLFIYAFTALDKLERIDYIEAVEQLKTFAAENKCREVLAFVRNENFVRLLKKYLDAEVTSTVVEF